MYEFIVGKVVDIQPGYIVLLTSNIGYKIIISNPYQLQENSESKIYLEQIVRENEISLYGFLSIEEKQLFQSLITVSGIGPKSALAILSNDNAADLINAVESEDLKYLQSFPGVGKKTAQQIILDLKGKVNIPNSGQQIVTANHNLDNALLALLALGYSEKDVSNIKPKLAPDDLSTDEYISLGLKLLIK